MTADTYRYTVEGLGFDDVVRIIDRAVAPGRFSLVQRIEGMVTYDCDWVEGPYVNVTSQGGRVKLALDGSMNGFGQAESALKGIFGNRLAEEE